MIDWDRVIELRGEVGDDDFAEVVTIFLEEAGDILTRMATAQTVECYRSDLHLLKGSALNLGFVELAASCQPEPAAQLVDGSGRARHVEGLCDVFERSRIAFLAPTAS